MKNRQHAYTEESLGRPAVFYLPSDLMGTEIEPGKTCRQVVTEFLEESYGGYTDEGNSHNGFWRSGDGEDFNNKYQKYVVSFAGKDRVPALKSFLAYVAVALRQQTIYLQTGEDAFLITPQL